MCICESRQRGRNLDLEVLWPRLLPVQFGMAFTQDTILPLYLLDSFRLVGNVTAFYVFADIRLSSTYPTVLPRSRFSYTYQIQKVLRFCMLDSYHDDIQLCRSTVHHTILVGLTPSLGKIKSIISFGKADDSFTSILALHCHFYFFTVTVRDGLIQNWRRKFEGGIVCQNIAPL
jgi:hypothetical protein